MLLLLVIFKIIRIKEEKIISIVSIIKKKDKHICVVSIVVNILLIYILVELKHKKNKQLVVNTIKLNTKIQYLKKKF